MQACEKNNESVEDRFTKRSDTYNKITRSIAKYEFRKILDSMEIRLSEFELKSLRNILDPEDTGNFSLKPFFEMSASTMHSSTRLLSSIMKD